MNETARLLLITAAFAAPALAQTATHYDPDRNCRIYVVQRLPVPVRCMAELLGNWSAKPYIDGAFMFRNRKEWLTWKDRDDYRRWKSHDFAENAAPSASAPPASTANQPTASLLCPREIAVRFTVEQSSLQGWSNPGETKALHLEGSLQTESGTLYCHYGSGTVTLSRPVWGHCVPRADASGFDCTP